MLLLFLNPGSAQSQVRLGLGETLGNGRWQGVGLGGLRGSFQPRPFHGSVIPGAHPEAVAPRGSCCCPILTAPRTKVGGNLWRSPCPAPHGAAGASQVHVPLGWSSTASLGSLSRWCILLPGKRGFPVNFRGNSVFQFVPSRVWLCLLSFPLWCLSTSRRSLRAAEVSKEGLDTAVVEWTRWGLVTGWTR